MSRTKVEGGTSLDASREDTSELPLEALEILRLRPFSHTIGMDAGVPSELFLELLETPLILLRIWGDVSVLFLDLLETPLMLCLSGRIGATSELALELVEPLLGLRTPIRTNGADTSELATELSERLFLRLKLSLGGDVVDHSEPQPEISLGISLPASLAFCGNSSGEPWWLRLGCSSSDGIMTSGLAVLRDLRKTFGIGMHSTIR